MPRLTTGRSGSTDVEIAFEDVGSGRPVVLIHGWPLSGRSWEPQVAALVEAGYRVLTYDRRGFGDSSRPYDGYDYDTFAADLHALLEHLDLRDVTLVGFSMGGGEVARYLARYGSDRIRSAVLAAAITPALGKVAGNPDGGLDEATRDAFIAGLRTDRPAFLDGFLTTFFSVRGELAVSEPTRQFALQIALPASPQGTAQCVAAWVATDFRADLAGTDVPVLVIHGDSDAVVPFEVSGKRVPEFARSARVVLIPDAPHGLNTSHPGPFNEVLLAFLAE